MTLKKTIAAFVFALLLAAAIMLPISISYAQEPVAQQDFSISYQQLQDALSQALEESGAGDKVEAIVGNVNSRVYFASTRPLELKVAYLHYDDRSNRWDGEIALHDNGELVKSESMNGRYNAMQEVPVLTRRIFSGEVIHEEDIGSALIATNRLRKGTVYDSSNLIGMAARRAMREGQPIAAHEIEAPNIISRGDILSLRYRTGALEISTTAEAMEDAPLGKTIMVRNTDSGNSLRATVVAAGIVEIKPQLLLSHNETRAN